MNNQEQTRRTVHDLMQLANQQVTQYSPSAALEAVQCQALLIDIRTPTERQREGVIPGSLHIPRNVLEWCCDPASGYANPAIRGMEHTLILVCSEGYSSNLAALTLKGLGFNRVGNLAGGYRGWKAAALPTKAPDRPPEQEVTGMNPPESAYGINWPKQWKRITLRYWLYRLFLRLFQ